MSDAFTRYVITLTRKLDHPRDEELIRSHVAYLRGLDKQGLLVLAGPFDDGRGGMVIIKAESLEAAQAVANADPFVTSGSVDAEVRTWKLSCEENNHLGMA